MPDLTTPAVPLPSPRREERRRYKKRRYDRDPAYVRKILGQCRQRRTGMTPEQYDQFLIDQAGLCAVCDEQMTGTNIHADHDHQSGRSRGLVCASCNRGLHYLDNPGWIEKARRYLNG